MELLNLRDGMDSHTALEIILHSGNYIRSAKRENHMRFAVASSVYPDGEKGEALPRHLSLSPSQCWEDLIQMSPKHFDLL